MPFPFPSSEKSDSNLILSFSRHQFLGASAPLWCLDSFQIWESYKGNGVRLTKHIIVLDYLLQKAESVCFEVWGLNRNLELRAASRVTAASYQTRPSQGYQPQPIPTKAQPNSTNPNQPQPNPTTPNQTQSNPTAPNQTQPNTDPT